MSNETEDEYFGGGTASPPAPTPGNVTVTVTGIFLAESVKAVLLECADLAGDMIEEWFPKSQFKRSLVRLPHEDETTPVVLFVPTWLVDAKKVGCEDYDPADWEHFPNLDKAESGQVELPLNTFD